MAPRRSHLAPTPPRAPRAALTTAALLSTLATLAAAPTIAQPPAAPRTPATTPASAASPAAAPDALTAATRILDQLAIEGLETAVLLGLPTPGERDRVGVLAREALDRLKTAEVELSGRAVTIGAIDPAAARRIRDVDLALRVPLLRARASLLAGVAERDLSRLSGAIDLLEATDPLAVAPAALRRVNLALALYHRALLMGALPGTGAGTGGGTGGGAGTSTTTPATPEAADIRRAFDLLRWIGEAQVGTDAATTVPPILLAEAWFAAIRIISFKEASLAVAQNASAAESRPPFVGGNNAADPGMLLRHAQVRAAAMASLWTSGGRANGFATVIAPIDAATKPARLGLSEAQCRAIRDELIGRAAGAILDAGAPVSELPTSAIVHWGGVLSREPAMRGRAIELLDLALTRPDIADPPSLAPEAHMHAALALSASTDPTDRVFAIQRLIGAVQGGLREPRRGAILAVLPALAQQAVDAAEAAKTHPARAELLSASGRLRLEALKLAGRGAQGGLAIAQAELRASAEPDAPTLARVLDALAAVPQAPPGKDNAEATAAEQLGAAAVDAALQRARATLAKFPTPESAGQLARVAQLGIDWHRSRNQEPLAARARVALAEAYVAAGDKRAIDLYRELLATKPPPDQPLRMTIGLARAQRASGDMLGAFATYRGMVDLLEEEPTKRPEYFLAWADMLQMLAADNATGHRNAQIRLRISQLRAADPALGSPEAQETIDMIERVLKN
ncbi:MAG: hypothetical protein MUE97_02915 [Phycisphaerales bacterium]|nr:hypothetical protein [Phycisphaerales bacterium]